MKKQNRPAWITSIAALILLLVALGLLQYLLIRQSFIITWQNMIGILYEKSPQLCEETVPYLFERDMFWNTAQQGEDAIIALGYTKKGVSYLFQNSGLGYVYLGTFIVQAALALLLFYLLIRLRKKQAAQEELLAQDIRDAITQWAGLKAEDYPFLDPGLIHEMSDALGLLHAKEQFLQKKNRDTQMFIENISHQIKTPLSCISISLDLVLEEAKQAQKKRILECFGYLGNVEMLLKRLLDIGRLEAGKIIMRKEPFEMEQLLEECKSTLPDAEQRIFLSIEGGAYQKRPYYGDFEWLKEAFLNILKNCLEHDNSSEPISVTISQNAEGIKITVRDHGPGIMPEDLPFIFDRFYIPKNAKKSHSGIGLNLAKLIIDRHFGVFHVKNHDKCGAIFTIVLPVFALKHEKL